VLKTLRKREADLYYVNMGVLNMEYGVKFRDGNPSKITLNMHMNTKEP